MIASLRLKNFKNFADETLRLGPFTAIVGANASGKSNIRDAFRFLHGIGRGYTLAEIVGGKYGAGGQREWAPIRGATNEIIRLDTPSHPAFCLEIGLTVEGEATTYVIEVGSEIIRSGFYINYERLKMAKKRVYKKLDRGYRDRRVSVGTEGNASYLDIEMDRPALVQVFERKGTYRINREKTQSIIDAFGRMRFLDFSPDRMREPAFSGQTILGDRGDNLPTVLRKFCTDSKRKSTLIDWIRELTPMDVRDFEFPSDPSGRIHLSILEKNDRRISAYSASDGTLRFLAMLAALLGEDSGGLYFFEDIENGLHPSRLHLLVDLIEQQTAKGQAQVIATTHSPELLSMLSDKTFKNTSVTCRLEDTNDAIIRPVADLPNAETLRTTQGLGRLFAGAWMETALAFTEEKGEDERARA